MKSHAAPTSAQGQHASWMQTVKLAQAVSATWRITSAPWHSPEVNASTNIISSGMDKSVITTLNRILILFCFVFWSEDSRVSEMGASSLVIFRGESVWLTATLVLSGFERVCDCGGSNPEYINPRRKGNKKQSKQRYSVRRNLQRPFIQLSFLLVQPGVAKNSDCAFLSLCRLCICLFRKSHILRRAPALTLPLLSCMTGLQSHFASMRWRRSLQQQWQGCCPCC